MNTNQAKNRLLSAGLTRMEVLAIVACVVLLGGFIFLPALAKARMKADLAQCQNNLIQLGLAFRTWEGDFGDRYPMSVPFGESGTKGSVQAFRSFQVMSNVLNNPKIVVCSADTRKVARSFEVLANARARECLAAEWDGRVSGECMTENR
jgi:hypothetical protein